MTSSGRLEGIALRRKIHAPMETANSGVITLDEGLAGDARGAKFKSRQITVLALEDWERALASLNTMIRPVTLPWTTRRANLLVAGLRLPRAKGARITVGSGVVLEVTGQTHPCHRMETAYPGLLSALAPEWRGGLTCRVLAGGPIVLGDEVTVASSPPEQVIRLP